mmetsp:Transcript_3181/g.7987  ORF Transcript_3181/g.7987 Transcript_3181/m.7987 type:complete len:658 (+) Transcript_3181:394-2367(+)
MLSCSTVEGNCCLTCRKQLLPISDVAQSLRSDSCTGVPSFHHPSNAAASGIAMLLFSRITMLPIFPKDVSFCTKMPIRVKMHYKKHGPTKCSVSFDAAKHFQGWEGVNMADFQVSVDLDKDNKPSEAVRKMMDKVHDLFAAKRSVKHCIVEHELTVSISSEHVPTMEIVDLPGIREFPEDMRAATRSLAQSYASNPTCILLCVVPATTARLESSQAMGIVQELRGASRTVCVLSKCDEVNVSKESNLRKMRERIIDPAVECDPPLACVVGLKNRDTDEEAENKTPSATERQLMQQSLQAEQEWFGQWMPELSRERNVSLHALIVSLDHRMCEHIVKSWIPAAMSSLERTKGECEEKLAALGMVLATSADFFPEFEKLEAQILAVSRYGIDEKISGENGSLSGPGWPARISNLQQVDDRQRIEEDLREAVLNPSNLHDLVDVMRQHVIRYTELVPPEGDGLVQRLRDLLKIDKVGSWFKAKFRMSYADQTAENIETVNPEAEAQAFNWGRYPTVRGRLLSAIESAAWGRYEDTKPKIGAYLDTYLLQNQGLVLDDGQARLVKYNATLIIAQHVILPLLRPGTLSGFLREMPDFEELIQEDRNYVQGRANLVQRMSQIDRSMDMLGAVQEQMVVQLKSLKAGNGDAEDSSSNADGYCSC